jgi:leucyl aminopeptidase
VVTFSAAAGDLADAEVDLLVVGATRPADADDRDELVAPELDDTGTALGERLGYDVADACRAAGFDGAAGTAMRLPTRGAVPAQLVLVVGLGTAADVSAEALRRAGAPIADATARLASLATTLHRWGDVAPDAAARAVVEGITLGAYRFASYKSKDDGHALADVQLVGGDTDTVEGAIALGQVSAGATVLTRDLVNTPSGDKRPPAFADRARELVADLPVEVTVLDQAALEAGGYGGHLGVSAGSDVEPRLVELRYRPEGATRHVALVGKGITFDSGGLSLKPPKAMEWMKVDMGGAATVLAAVRGAAQLGLPVAVTGLLCLAENMPSGSATRPGDVLRIRGGKTVEVLNTDAEGRLVMADGLVHAGELDPAPDVVVDLATLTGSVLHAVGPKYVAVMANDDAAADGLLAASATAGEPMWRLPLAVEEYAEDLKSEVADVRNVGGNAAGTIRAALFLREFVPEGTAWAHLDIAGAAWNDGQPYGHVPRNGTGIPARTLLDWLRAG